MCCFLPRKEDIELLLKKFSLNWDDLHNYLRKEVKVVASQFQLCVNDNERSGSISVLVSARIQLKICFCYFDE